MSSTPDPGEHYVMSEFKAIRGRGHNGSEQALFPKRQQLGSHLIPIRSTDIEPVKKKRPNGVRKSERVPEESRVPSDLSTLSPFAVWNRRVPILTAVPVSPIRNAKWCYSVVPLGRWSSTPLLIPTGVPTAACASALWTSATCAVPTACQRISTSWNGMS